MQKIKRFFYTCCVACALTGLVFIGTQLYALRDDFRSAYRAIAGEPEAQAMVNSRGEVVVIEDGPPMDYYSVDDKEKLNEIFKDAYKKHGLDERLVGVIFDKESYGGRMTSYKFEPGQMEKVRKMSSNPDIQRMLASSHCAGQVMGFNMPLVNERLGTKWTWADLYNPKVCAEASASILAACIKRQKGSTDKRIYSGFLCYNGAVSYANDAMQILRDKIIASANLRIPEHG